MNIDKTLERCARPARAAWVAAAGLGVILALQTAIVWVRARAERRLADAASAEEALDDASMALSENASLLDLRAKDLSRFKNDLSKLTRSRRALYEGGLQIQEEFRLLQKQWEIMTTYLLIDEDARKISLMRGEQALETYAIGYPPEAFGGEAKPPPPLSAIVSKERFAHPERGKSETVDGQLQWEPPQVGTSVRANALGEFVMFTKGSLVIHGPAKKTAEHLAFPHYCIGLSLSVARRLYQLSYMGTKIKIVKK